MGGGGGVNPDQKRQVAAMVKNITRPKPMTLYNGYGANEMLVVCMGVSANSAPGTCCVLWCKSAETCFNKFWCDGTSNGEERRG